MRKDNFTEQEISQIFAQIAELPDQDKINKLKELQQDLANEKSQKLEEENKRKLAFLGLMKPLLKYQRLLKVKQSVHAQLEYNEVKTQKTRESLVTPVIYKRQELTPENPVRELSVINE